MTPTAARARVAAIGLVAGSALITVAYGARAITGAGGEDARQLFSLVAFPAVMLLAAFPCALRASVPGRHRGAWALIALGCVSGSAGQASYTLMAWGGRTLAVPSIADALWLLGPLLLGVGVVLVARDGASTRRRGSRLDALLGAATVATVAAALMGEPALIAAQRHSLAGFLTNLAFPVIDTLVMSTVFALVILRGWRVPGMLVVLMGSAGLVAASDSVYQSLIASGTTYVGGGLLDVGWLVAAVGFATASLMPDRPGRLPDREHPLGQIVPVALAAVALAVLVTEALADRRHITVIASGLALLVALARLAVSLGENRARLQESRAEALSDPLTGLGNRRRLSPTSSSSLPASRPLLPHALRPRRLQGLQRHVRARRGRHPAPAHRRRARARRGSRRSGVQDGRRRVLRIFRRVRTRADRGAGPAHAGRRRFPRHGLSRRAAGARARPTALRRRCGSPTRRLYACKFGTRGTAGRQSRRRSAPVLQERGDAARPPDCHDVAALAEATAAQPRPHRGEVDQVAHSPPRLHDIGKLAIPEAILSKPGPLDEREWRFMRRHTMIGERIVAPRRRSPQSPASCARATSASTARATPTAWPARRSRSARGSSLSATPSTR